MRTRSSALQRVVQPAARRERARARNRTSRRGEESAADAPTAEGDGAACSSGWVSTARHFPMFGTAKIAAAAPMMSAMADQARTRVLRHGLLLPAPRNADSGSARSRDGFLDLRRGALLETVEPVEHRQRLLARRALQHGGLEQPPRFARLAAIESGDAVLQQFLGLALPFGSALRARSMYARARGWLRSRNSARVQTLIACSYSAAK